MADNFFLGSEINCAFPMECRNVIMKTFLCVIKNCEIRLAKVFHVSPAYSLTCAPNPEAKRGLYTKSLECWCDHKGKDKSDVATKTDATRNWKWQGTDDSRLNGASAPSVSP